MSTHHAHGVGCTHCCCNNPVVTILRDKLFPAKKSTKTTASFAQPAPESLVITGGTIRPMIGGSTDTVEAIGIYNGNVVSTGTLADVESYMNNNNIQYTLKQLSSTQTLLPGLIEPHVHIVPSAMLEGWSDLSCFDGQVLRTGYTLDWVTSQISSTISSHPDIYNDITGFWYLGRGVDPALMPFTEGTNGGLNVLSTIKNPLLDSVSLTVPILILSASMHTMYANTAAMTKIYNNPKNAATWQQLKYTTVQDYINATQGQLEEAEGMTPALHTIPDAQLAVMFAECDENLTALFTEANTRGVTFMYDAGLDQDSINMLLAYTDVSQRRVRTGGALVCANEADVSKLPAYSQPTEYSDVYLGSVKIVSDGSNQGLTGYQSIPYCCETDQGNGIFNFSYGENDPTTPPAQYLALVNSIVNTQGWPLMIHANGDYAVQFAIAAYSSAISGGGTSKRNRIEHCSILNSASIQQMASLGVSPSFLIGHVGYWGYAFDEAIFEEKAQQLDLCQSALNANMRISLHSDYQVSPIGPLRMMEQSITRIMEGAPDMQQPVLNAAECLAPEDALRAITYDAAWQCYAENWVGSLTSGNFADFAILAQDPLSLTDYYMNLRNIAVDETWVGGVCVYTPAYAKQD